MAIQVDPNNPETMFTLDDVDWNQIPPDNNTGIQMPIQLLTSNALSDADAHVVENNAADLLNALDRRDEAMERLKSAVAIFAEIGEDAAAEPEIWKLVEW